jgi:ABC-type nitrate/sulfonate/bicarbonate transport system substrate-binding protein
MQRIRSVALGAIVGITAALGQGAAAQDKVKVGVFPTASSLPYFIAIERGFFKEQNIEPETTVWKKGIDFVNNNPQEARKYLAKNTLTPEDVVDTVPMVRYYMAGELTDKHKAEFQKFIDFSTSVGTLPERVDITKFLQVY